MLIGISRVVSAGLALYFWGVVLIVLAKKI